MASRNSSSIADGSKKSQARRLEHYPNAILRMPLRFGPFPGPRQTEHGVPHDGWSDVSVTTATITFKSSKRHLSTFLPHDCFHIDSENESTFASISLTRLENLPWLDGHGYHHFGIYIHDVVCTGKTESVRGKYLVVLFENRADPICSGREELGYAKLYCSLEDQLNLPKGIYSLNASWEGTSFGTMKLAGLREYEGIDVKTSEKTPQGIIHFKYIPRTGEPGHCDVQYPTFSPSVAAGVNVVEKLFVADTSAFGFEVTDKARLPTISHVVSGLAEIQQLVIVDARVTISKGQSDLRDHRAIQI